MKRVTMTVLLISLALTTGAIGQDKPPSFFELSEYRFRFPETDTNIDLYQSSWRDSHHQVAHGGFLERAVFVPGDPLAPEKPGAVLSSLSSYTHGILNPGCRTNPIMHDDHQVFMFVTGGEAEVTAGGSATEQASGSWVFIPAGIEYGFFNAGDSFFEVVILTETVASGFHPAQSMSTGHYTDSIPDTGWQWAYDYYEIGAGRDFQGNVRLGMAIMSRFDISHPYVTRAGTEEIWYQVTGESMMLFGTHLRIQRPGDACYVPPNGRIPRGSINMTGEPMMWLYFCSTEE